MLNGVIISVMYDQLRYKGCLFLSSPSLMLQYYMTTTIINILKLIKIKLNKLIFIIMYIG